MNGVNIRAVAQYCSESSTGKIILSQEAINFTRGRESRRALVKKILNERGLGLGQLTNGILQVHYKKEEFLNTKTDILERSIKIRESFSGMASEGYLSSSSSDRRVHVLPQDFERWLFDNTIPIEKLESLLDQNKDPDYKLKIIQWLNDYEACKNTVSDPGNTDELSLRTRKKSGSQRSSSFSVGSSCTMLAPSKHSLDISSGVFYEDQDIQAIENRRGLPTNGGDTSITGGVTSIKDGSTPPIISEDTPIAGEETCEGTLTTSEDTPTTSEDTPTTGEDTPTTGEDTPIAGEDTPIAGESTPTTGRGIPIMDGDTSITGRGNVVTDKELISGEDEFFPGEEQILIARGEILAVHELKSINGRSTLAEKIMNDTKEMESCGIFPSNYVRFHKERKNEFTNDASRNPDPILLEDLHLVPWEKSCSEDTLSCESSEEFIERIVEECSFLRRSEPSSENVRGSNHDQQGSMIRVGSTGFLVQKELAHKYDDDDDDDYIDENPIIYLGALSEWNTLAQTNFEDAIANEPPWLTMMGSQGFTVTLSETALLAEISSTDLLLLENSSWKHGKSDHYFNNSEECEKTISVSSSLPILKRNSSPPLLRSCISLASSGYSSLCSNHPEAHPTEVSMTLSSTSLEKLEISTSTDSSKRDSVVPPTPVLQSLGNETAPVILPSLDAKATHVLGEEQKEHSNSASNNNYYCAGSCSGVDHSYNNYLKELSEDPPLLQSILTSSECHVAAFLSGVALEHTDTSASSAWFSDTNSTKTPSLAPSQVAELLPTNNSNVEPGQAWRTLAETPGYSKCSCDKLSSKMASALISNSAQSGNCCLNTYLPDHSGEGVLQSISQVISRATDLVDISVGSSSVHNSNNHRNNPQMCTWSPQIDTNNSDSALITFSSACITVSCSAGSSSGATDPAFEGNNLPMVPDSTERTSRTSGSQKSVTDKNVNSSKRLRRSKSRVNKKLFSILRVLSCGIIHNRVKH